MADERGEERQGLDPPSWRRPAPRARAVTIALYSWRRPELVFILSMLAAAPFVLAALLSPALLSFSPTLDIIAPVADARAVASGHASLLDAASPFHLALLSAGDLFFDSPGRIHLAAKAFAAFLVAAPFAWFVAPRFPAAQGALLTAALAAFVAAPFSGPNDISLALFAVLAAAFLAAPGDEGRGRARLEGALAGAILLALWLSHPVFALLGFLALSACPFLSGRRGLDRYLVALAVMLALAAAAEAAAPGLNVARAQAASGAFSAAGGSLLKAGASANAAIAASTLIVLIAAAIFGGRDHARGWVTAALLLAVSVAAVRVADAQAAPLFVLAASIAAFSVASPFYDGVFRFHDRASIALAGSAAALTMFWTAAIVAQSAGQFALQLKTAEATAGAGLGVAQMNGQALAHWIGEGRLSPLEARNLLALAPVDQSAILVEAAERARILTREGLDVAILTGADSLCVLLDGRPCSADGPAAAKAAKVVFVPRIDFDAATAAAKGRSEAFLYTEFRRVEATPLWDVWVRRGVTLPGAFSSP